MASDRVSFEEFTQLREGLRGMDADTRKALRKELRAIAEPEARLARGRVLRGRPGQATASGAKTVTGVRVRNGKAVKSKGFVSLRRSMAKAITVEVPLSGKRGSQVLLKVKRSKLPPRFRGVGRAWDRKDGWRHPLFGQRSVSIHQTGSPYFVDPLVRRLPRMRSELVKAMQRHVRNSVSKASKG